MQLIPESETPTNVAVHISFSSDRCHPVDQIEDTPSYYLYRCGLVEVHRWCQKNVEVTVGLQLYRCNHSLTISPKLYVAHRAEEVYSQIFLKVKLMIHLWRCVIRWATINALDLMWHNKYIKYIIIRCSTYSCGVNVDLTTDIFLYSFK